MASPSDRAHPKGVGGLRLQGCTLRNANQTGIEVRGQTLSSQLKTVVVSGAASHRPSTRNLPETGPVSLLLRGACRRLYVVTTAVAHVWPAQRWSGRFRTLASLSRVLGRAR